MNRLSSRKQTILESILIRPKETLSTNNLTTRLTFVLWCSVQVYSCSLQRDYIFRNGKCYLSRSFVIDSILCTSATRCASTLNIHCNLHHFKHIHKLVRWFIEISETKTSWFEAEFSIQLFAQQKGKYILNIVCSIFGFLRLIIAVQILFLKWD